MSRCSASSSPSLVPFAVQTGAKTPGFSPTAPEFTAETDSPLEGRVTSELVSEFLSPKIPCLAGKKQGICTVWPCKAAR